MDDLDLLLKKEIPIQAPPDNTLQVVIPVNPNILTLPRDVRTDESIAREVLDTLTGEYEADVELYVKGAELSDEIARELRIADYLKFNRDWRFSFRESNGFLSLLWDFGDKHIEFGYMWAPVVVENRFTKGTGKLATYEDMVPSTGDMGVILWYTLKGYPDLVLFQKEKLLRFKHPAIEFRAEDQVHAEAVVPAFASTYMSNVPQALLLRSFGVKYLNALMGKVQEE